MTSPRAAAGFISSPPTPESHAAPDAPTAPRVVAPPKSRLAQAFGAWSSRWGRGLGAFGPQAVAATVAWIERLAARLPRLFPVDVHGLERVPAAPSLFVGNHSGG